jgi:hypothetical protein
MKLILKIAAVGAVVYGVVLLNRWAHARTLDESDTDDIDDIDDASDDELAAPGVAAMDAELVSDAPDPVPAPRPTASRRKNLRP